MTYRGPTRAEIRNFNGVPTLFINGEPHSSFSYMTYADRDRASEYYEDFGKINVDLCSFAANADGLTLWGMDDVWQTPDTFDYSGEDAMYGLDRGVLVHVPLLKIDLP